MDSAQMAEDWTGYTAGAKISHSEYMLSTELDHPFLGG